MYMKMQLLINIKKIEIGIWPSYGAKKYIQINYKDYIHGRKFWFYDKTFTTLFKDIYHGCSLWCNIYKHYNRFLYKNEYIYSDAYNICISLDSKKYKLKK